MMSTGGHSILVYGDGQHVTDSYEAVPIVPSTIPVAAGDESDSNCENEIEGEFRLHPDNTHVYTLDRSKRSQKSVVTKRILWECGKLTTCNSCLTSENPLCGWCAQETTCTLETQCKSLVWIQALSETSEGKDDDLEPLCGFQNGVISSDYSLKFNPTSTLLTPSLDFCGSIIPDPTGSFASPETPLISVSVFVDDVPCTNVTYPAKQCQADDNGFSFSCTLLSQKRPLDGPVYGQFLLGVGPSYTRMRLTSTENFEWRVPTIETFSPRKGPMSGGTLVEILGTDLLFRSDPQIVIGDQPCQTMESSTDTKLQCKTSPVQDANIQSLISINYKGNDLEYIAESRDKYTYTEDPTVSQISPTRVFLGGGFLHDVVGTNLDTVAGPNFVVAMTENNVQTAEWSSPCEVKTPTFMQCPTPKIDLPSNIDVNYDDGQCGLISATTDGKNVQFGFGFTFDGVKEWQPENIAATLDNTFTIARNPVFDNFKGENDILTIEPTDNMTITGKRLDCGPQMKYLQIEVGDGFCDVISINQTFLECQPMSINETLSVHPVQVLIGTSVDIANVYDVGYLKYQEFFTTTEQTTTISSPPTTHRNLSTTNLRTTTRRTTHGGVGRTTTTIPTNKTLLVSSPASEDRQTSRKTVAYAPQTQGIWSTQMISIAAACGAVVVVIIVIIVVACVVVRKKRVNDHGVHNNNLNHGNNIPVKESVTYVPNKEENDNSKVYFLPQTEKQEFKYTDV
ncbi:plexin-A3-like [Ptychodera flava]|uniref:plexin-A3-like n=1 Tax=Ptychodera flava TaxID=63121 RepID=UPI003969E34D